MLFMVLAALLLTQCKKPSIEFPTPSVTTTVSMTITAGPGSKTDITTEGGIVWSAGDKIYVGDGSKYVGCLAIQSGVGNATGTFTGDVTVATGDDCTFHFYYLGHDNGVAPAADATEVTVDFSSQNIYEDNNHKLKNASGQHVGYGKAEHVKVEADKPIMGLEVSMKSKVAIAYFCFQKGDGESATPYTGALRLGGEHIYNKMTVNFNAGDFSFSVTKGDISLANTTTHLKYAMLVPAGTSAATLNFGGGDVTGATALENGIEANKFYRIDGSMPIEVTVKPVEFTVDANGTKVEFAPGNLQYLGQAEEGHKWRFADHQWDYMGAGPSATSNRGNVDLRSLGYLAGMYNTSSGSEAARDLFGWGCTGSQDARSDAHDYQTNFQPYSTSTSKVNTTYNYFGYGPDYYDASKYGLSVKDKSDWGCLTIGSDPAGTWRTLSNAEWAYLFNTRTVNVGTGEGKSYQRATINSDASDGSKVYGMLLYPDGYTAQTGATSYTKADWSAMESAGVVFLPAAGDRYGTSLYYVGSYGFYWSSSCYSSDYACFMYFYSDTVRPARYDRCRGFPVRLVR